MACTQPNARWGRHRARALPFRRANTLMPTELMYEMYSSNSSARVIPLLARFLCQPDSYANCQMCPPNSATKFTCTIFYSRGCAYPGLVLVVYRYGRSLSAVRSLWWWSGWWGFKLEYRLLLPLLLLRVLLLCRRLQVGVDYLEFRVRKGGRYFATHLLSVEREYPGRAKHHVSYPALDKFSHDDPVVLLLYKA